MLDSLGMAPSQGDRPAKLRKAGTSCSASSMARSLLHEAPQTVTGPGARARQRRALYQRHQFRLGNHQLHRIKEFPLARALTSTTTSRGIRAELPKCDDLCIHISTKNLKHIHAREISHLLDNHFRNRIFRVTSLIIRNNSIHTRN